MTNECLPELGSTEAAVRSYVNLFCKATGLKEDVTAYWLDCYYQIRKMHEKQKEEPIFHVTYPSGVFAEHLSPPINVQGLAPEEAGRKEVTAGKAFKLDVLERIEKYKAAGITYGMMVNTCGQAFGMSLILDAVNATPLSERQWKALDRGLKKVALAHAEILAQKEGAAHA